MATPYVGFSNDTLQQAASLKNGDMITCPHCGNKHGIECGKEDGKETDLLMFYRCGETSYLAGIAGRAVGGITPDVSGNI